MKKPFPSFTNDGRTIYDHYYHKAEIITSSYWILIDCICTNTDIEPKAIEGFDHMFTVWAPPVSANAYREKGTEIVKISKRHIKCEGE